MGALARRGQVHGRRGSRAAGGCSSICRPAWQLLRAGLSAPATQAVFPCQQLDMQAPRDWCAPLATPYFGATCTPTPASSLIVHSPSSIKDRLSAAAPRHHQHLHPFLPTNHARAPAHRTPLLRCAWRWTRHPPGWLTSASSTATPSSMSRWWVCRNAGVRALARRRLEGKGRHSSFHLHNLRSNVVGFVVRGAAGADHPSARMPYVCVVTFKHNGTRGCVHLRLNRP